MTETPNSRPFDRSAERYDDVFTHSRTGRLQRQRVWGVVDRVLPKAGRFIDLGCGTGEDALWLVRRGAREVVGLDASPAMLTVARDKAIAAGAGACTAFHAVDLARLSTERPPLDGPFDGALADFGVLNCLENRRPLAEQVARWLVAGAPFAVVVMGPWCAWEVAWHLLRLQPRAAFRRWRQGDEVVVEGGNRIRVWYPTATRLRHELHPWFELIDATGIGVFLPPPYLEGIFRGRSRWLTALDALEARLGHRRPWWWMADHLLLVFRRTDEAPPPPADGAADGQDRNAAGRAE